MGKNINHFDERGRTQGALIQKLKTGSYCREHFYYLFNKVNGQMNYN